VGADDTEHEPAQGDETSSVGARVGAQAHEGGSLQRDHVCRSVHHACSTTGVAGLARFCRTVAGVAGDTWLPGSGSGITGTKDRKEKKRFITDSGRSGVRGERVQNYIASVVFVCSDLGIACANAITHVYTPKCRPEHYSSMCWFD